MTYPFFTSNEFIYLWESIWTSKIFFYVFEIFFKILNIECNVTNFGYVFVPRFYTAHKNFSNDSTNSYPIASIFFQKEYFEKRKKNSKNWYGFWKINKFIRNVKKDRLPACVLKNYFVNQLVNNFSALLLCKINVFYFFI